MALKPKDKPDQPAAPISRQTESYWRWLEKVREAFRKMCHSDARMIRECEAKAMAAGIAMDLQSEPDARKCFAMVFDLSRKKAIAPDEELVAANLFRRRREARDKIAERLGKHEAVPWDDFYAAHTSARKLPYLGELMVELGIIKRSA